VRKCSTTTVNRSSRSRPRRDDLFTVVVEHFLTDTARYADIILPATMQIEHRDLLIAYGHMYLAWNEPAVSPPGECLPASELYRRLARRLELDHPPLHDSDETIARQVLDSGHPSVDGITLEALKRRGSIRLNYPDPFVPFAGGFPTPSGRLEFVSDRMARDGLDAIAGYTPPRETNDETGHPREYPFALISPANHYFLNSMFANVPRQQERAGPPAVSIHPSDAAKCGIANGDEVRIANARGSFVAIAMITDAVRPGVLASSKGRWPGHSPDGATVNSTVDDGNADMGAGALYHDNRVAISSMGKAAR